MHFCFFLYFCMMGSSRNFQFNPHLYEDHLSAFGRKVLSVLKHKWKSDQNRTEHAYQEQFTTQQRKVLTFRNEGSYRPSPPMITKEMNTENDFQSDKSFDFNLMEQYVPPVSTSFQLIQTVDTSNQITMSDDINLSNLINPVINWNSDDLYKIMPGDNSTNPSTSVNKDKTDPKNTKDIDWDNMFDTELFSEQALTNAKLCLNEIESPVKKKYTEFPEETSKKSDDTKSNEIKHKHSEQYDIKKSKRKQQQITDAIPKKVKKISDKTKISFRKQKYTKAVKNWLDDVDPNNPVEKYEFSNKNTAENKIIKRDEVIIEKAKEKSNKKLIQAELANRDGIMKFTTPKTGNSRQAGNTTDITDKSLDKNDVTNNNTLKENEIERDTNKEKKNKHKFVAPIKSQLPVKDAEFRVITAYECIKDHLNTRRIENKEIVIVIIYNNGFCQLNNHHTEDTCDPEGIIVMTDDEFFYFRGSHQNNNEIVRKLLKHNKIVCYEGKSLLIYLKSKLDIDIHNIYMIDVKIGGSLLDPESPPDNFSELQKLLSFTPQFTIATECILQKSAWYVSLLKECGAKLTSLLMEEQLWNVFMEIEMKLLPIIAEMERRGVTVDLQKLKSMEEILMTRMKSRELECHKAAGKMFQINSPVQVRALIYDELQLDTKCNVKIRETLSKGAKSTSESMLRSLVSVHPLPKLILEYRHLHKAHTTFLTGIAQHVKDDIVRPSWVQTAAATGRIASNNPNLQAIPKAPFSVVLFPENDKTDIQVLSMRSVYTARAGYTLLAADFKHVECRVFAHAAADTALLATLRGRQDLFRALAHKWLNKPEAEVTAEDRERTKRIVYASLYGAGCGKLMDILAVSCEQALSIVASFNKTFPSLKSFGRSVVSRCQNSGGRLATLCGRARRFRNIASSDFALRSQAERQAVNFIVQGSAADLCKMAMVLTSEQLRDHSPPVDGYLLLQIHDELVWEIRDEQLDIAAVMIKRVMEGCGYQSGMSANLPVSISTGKNWGEMTEYLTDTQ